jgi:hypothetical protein
MISRLNVGALTLSQLRLVLRPKSNNRFVAVSGAESSSCDARTHEHVPVHGRADPSS